MSRTSKPQADSLSSIDLFSGAGGLSLGLDRAGFKPVLAVEINKDACATYTLRFPNVDVKPVPIQTIDFLPYRGKVDLLAGGPPCQPFSSGGLRQASKDIRDMIPEFIRALSEARPRAFLMENVPGLVTGCRKDYFLNAIRSFEALGYAVSWEVVNAADYGVPQKRKRLFVVGTLDGKFVFPKPTHGTGKGKKKYSPVSAWLNLQEVKGEANPSIVTYAKNPDIRPNPYDGHLFNGGGRALDPNAPSHTILASAGGNKTHFVDPNDLVPKYHKHIAKGGKPYVGKTLKGARRLTVLESAILQTFPPEMVFCGSRSSQYTQVGNAVPPMLAAIIGKSIFEALQTRPEAISIAT